MGNYDSDNRAYSGYLVLGIPDIWKSPDCTRYDIDCGAAYPEYGGRLGCLRLNDLAEFYTEV